MKNKNYKRLICLICLFLFLPMFFSCTSIKEETVELGDDVLVEYEEKLNIELPYADKVIKTTYEYKDNEELIMFSCKIEVTYQLSEDLISFESSILKNNTFQNRLNTQLYVPTDYNANEYYTYYLFYNNDDNNFIDRPLACNTYNITQLAYVKDLRKLFIYDYQIII